jgi:NADPH:quinone reductase
VKAIRVHQFGGPEVLKLESLQDPMPRPAEVVVRVRAAGVNPFDTYMRAGTYGANNPSLPYTPGADAAGVIESVGPGVEDFKPGDRVFVAGTLSGAYAELALCGVEQLHRLPERVSFAQGAGIYIPYATAYRALIQLAHAKPGETVLVHGGSGGVGMAAIQFARAAGIAVIATAGSDEGLRMIEREGVQVAVNHHSPDYRQKIVDATKGRGADVILEMLANVNLGHDLKLLAQRGRVVVIGSRGDVQITPRDIMAREATVTGVFLWGLPAPDSAQIRAALQAGLSNGTLLPRIGLELPLASAAEAHRRILEPGAVGKIVLVP